MYTCLKLPQYQNVFPLLISAYYIYIYILFVRIPRRTALLRSFVLPRSFYVNTFPVAFLVLIDIIEQFRILFSEWL